MSAGITAGARGAAAGLGQASAGNARTLPPPRKPGLKSRSRGLETTARAAVERREASAPSADGWRHLFVWCGRFRLRLPALRLPLFVWRRNIRGFCSCRKTRARRRRENGLALPSPGGGGSRGGVRGDAGIRSALRALSPHPAALRAATFPLQGKVKEGEFSCAYASI